MDMKSKHQAHAAKLFQAFENGTPSAMDDALGSFSPEAKFFMWGPYKPPMTGVQEMRNGFEEMFKQLKDFRYRIVNVAEHRDILFIERVEWFTFKGIHEVEVSLVSVSKLGTDEKLDSWTDYFDSAILTNLE